MRNITEIFIHCAATQPKASLDVHDIRRWHKKRGWSDIGYHYVLPISGEVQEGRPLARSGAHVRGRNRNSIGICLIGGVDAQGKPEANYTPAQWEALAKLVKDLQKQFPDAKVRGHNEVSAKACPSFDVQAWIIEQTKPLNTSKVSSEKEHVSTTKHHSKRKSG